MGTVGARCKMNIVALRVSAGFKRVLVHHPGMHPDIAKIRAHLLLHVQANRLG